MRERIKRFIKSTDLNSSQFAECLGVNRSNITHILSGRNKPSIDFLERLIRTFPNINTNWIISGIGEMYLSKEKKEPIKSLEKVLIFYTDKSFQELQANK